MREIYAFTATMRSNANPPLIALFPVPPMDLRQHIEHCAVLWSEQISVEFKALAAVMALELIHMPYGVELDMALEEARQNTGWASIRYEIDDQMLMGWQKTKYSHLGASFN